MSLRYAHRNSLTRAVNKAAVRKVKGHSDLTIPVATQATAEVELTQEGVIREAAILRAIPIVSTLERTLRRIRGEVTRIKKYIQM